MFVVFGRNGLPFFINYETSESNETEINKNQLLKIRWYDVIFRLDVYLHKTNQLLQYHVAELSYGFLYRN